MSKSTRYTLNYTLINMSYFACFCGIHAYAAVFLLGRGFSNTTIGILLAVANIISVLLQPITAGYIDKYKQYTNKKVSIACAAIMAVLCVGLYFVQNTYAVFYFYLLVYSLQMIYQPLIMAMSFEYNAKGAGINFGLARGLGSCGFAITSAFIGNAVVALGVDSLQIINVIMLLIGIFMLAIFVLPEDDGENYVNQNNMGNEAVNGDIYQKDEALKSNIDQKNEVVKGNVSVDYVNQAGHNSLIDFIKYYPFFALFVLAGTCMFFAHNALNDYLIQFNKNIFFDTNLCDCFQICLFQKCIYHQLCVFSYLFQIITPIGGDERIMGYMVMMAAALELPTMSFFTRLEKRFGCKNLLMLSGIMFTVKTLIMLIAPNVFVAFISQSDSCLRYVYSRQCVFC